MRLRFGFGTAGCGATMSLCSSVQNGLIRLYKYHFRSSSSPFGSILGGRREGSGFQSSLTRERAVSDVSAYWRTNTVPGEEEVNRKWWNFLIPRRSADG